MEFRDFMSSRKNKNKKTPIPVVETVEEKKELSPIDVVGEIRQEQEITTKIKSSGLKFLGEVAILPPASEFEESTLVRVGQKVYIKQNDLWEVLIEGNTRTETIKYTTPVGGGCGVEEVKRIVKETAQPLSFATYSDLSAAVAANGGQPLDGTLQARVGESLYVWDPSANGGLGGYVLIGGPQSATTLTIRPGGAVNSRSTLGTLTVGVAINVPIAFESVEIGYIHRGGGGDAAGISALVAATDDIGPCDYALGGADANLKKFITPRSSGTEYNSISEIGWHAVTWAGANSISPVDPGAGKESVTWSDRIRLTSKVDSLGTSMRTFLFRMYFGTGGITYCNQLAGMTTGANALNDLTPNKIMYAHRVIDGVTNPASWSAALTPSLADSPFPAVYLRFHGAPVSATTVMFCGDSRFDADTETGTYHNFAVEVEKQSYAAGFPIKAMKVAQSGAASVSYLQWAETAFLNATAKGALYVSYTINENGGVINDLAFSIARANTISFIEACRKVGAVPLIVSAYPGGWWTAPQLKLLKAHDLWCSSLGVPYFSPLERYGDASGLWLPGFGYGGGNHMSQAGYAAMATDIIAYMREVGIL